MKEVLISNITNISIGSISDNWSLKGRTFRKNVFNNIPNLFGIISGPRQTQAYCTGPCSSVAPHSA
jgi:hypothetical protein